MAATDERILLIDTEPVLSLSVADELAQSDAPLPPNCGSHDQLAELRGHQLALWLLSVCDVVIVPQDWAIDFGLLRFLLICNKLLPVVISEHLAATAASEAAKAATPTVDGASSSSIESDALRAASKNSKPKVVHSTVPTVEMLPLFNRASGDYEELEPQQYYTKAVAAFFRYTPDHRYTNSAAGSSGPITAGAARKSLFLPNRQDGAHRIDAWNNAIKKLIQTTCGVQRAQARRPALTTGTSTHLSEREWWHRAKRVWNDVCSSRILADYVGSLYSV